MEMQTKSLFKNGITTTLPYNLYTDPQVLEQEKEKIFSYAWNYVGHINQVEKNGDYFTCEAAGEPIIVVRGQDGELRAFYNVCPHRATKLEKEEAGNKKILQCSYHGWTFKLDGQLHKAPNFKDTEDLCSGSHCLRAVKLETNTSLIFVNLDENAAPLAETYSDFFADLSQFGFIGKLKKYEVKKRVVKCNWKAFIDNFLECDHCPIAHPGFVATLDMSKYNIINGQNCNIQGSSVKSNRNDLDDAEVKEGRFYWIWPNVMYTVYPGPGNLSAIQMIPIDNETTLGVYTFYLEGDDPTKEQKELMAFAEQVRIEDVEIVELEQIGFRSRAFNQGICSPTEHGVHHFALLVQQALGL
ncbi:MAG: (2Fe-2S)-binding protein [Bacilli bacterium]|nr:(2Fe-2S)-binding protein [Bacilli bacterium]